jgi:hypothetical protein
MYAISRAVLSAALTYVAHYGVTKLYSSFCVPNGVWGFFQGSIITGSPMCASALTVMTNTHSAYSAMVLAGVSRFVVDIVADGATYLSGSAGDKNNGAAAQSHQE